LLSAGIAGTICFAALIAIYLIINRQEEAYYASLSAFFALNDEQADSVGKARMPAMDFEAVQNEFPNAVAWIQIIGTGVNYPVMHGTNNEYYMSRRPDGKNSRSGSIFIDYRNAPDLSSPNTFIYGHRMRSGAMFGTLSNYNSQSFYDKHPTVSIFTPKGNYELELFAGYTFNQKEEKQTMKFADAKAFENYVRNAKRRSMFKSDVEVNFGDRLVTLCTCEYSFDDARLFVVGKLVEKGS